jgi:hypothetical protein
VTFKQIVPAAVEIADTDDADRLAMTVTLSRR